MPKTPVVALAVAALLLTGCQSPPNDNPTGHGCEPTAPGQASDSVRVSGGEQSAPNARFGGLVAPGRTERTVLDAGHGRIADVGDLVTFAYAAYNGSSGDVIDTVGYGTPYSQATVDDTSMMVGLQKALLCSTPGSRLAVVIPPSEAFGDAGNEQFGIAADAAIVFVIDVVDVAADRADGKTQPVMDSLPEVKVGATGEPEITIPPKSPPTEFSATVLKKGAGEPVTEGGTVTVEYSGVDWSSGRTFDSSWRRHELVQLPTTSFVKGFGDALVGQSVGSQVLAIVPPALGYGPDGNPKFGISSTDTMVFVIDILAVVQPPATAPQE